MKKLMFVAAAAAAMAAVADNAVVQSANIVGYFGKSHSANTPSYGAAFEPVAGGETYKLGELTILSVDDEEPFDPNTEYFQLLDANDTHVIGRYTCLNQQTADAYRNIYEEPETAAIIEANLGWWDYESNKTISNVAEGKATNRDQEPIKVGQGFLLKTSSIGRKITSSGAVPKTSRAISTTSKAPFIASFCPAPIKLSQITVESVDDEEPFDPNSEYLQVLDSNDTHVIGRYTCLNQQTADAYRNIYEEPETAAIIEANLGWWDYESNKTISNVAEGKATNRDNETVNPGDAFLGKTSSIGRSFNIPSAIPAQD